jgi:hypothetical protein
VINSSELSEDEVLAQVEDLVKKKKFQGFKVP